MRTYKNKLFVLLRWLFVLITFIFVWVKLSSQELNFSELFSGWIMLSAHIGWLIVLVACMFLNWSLEAIKWQVLSKPLVSLSFLDAFKGVLSGLALGFWTPHALGDYAGRIWQIDSEKRSTLLGNILVGRMAQLLPTVFFGLASFFLLWPQQSLYIFVGLLMIMILSIWLFIKNWNLPNWISRKSWIKNNMSALEQLSVKSKSWVLLLSFARYLVFFGQFIILLRIWLPLVSLKILGGGVSFIFLMKSVAPTFNFLSDLGVREMAAVFFFSQHQVSLEWVTLSTFILWLLNILVPTLIGAFFMFQLKFTKT